MRRAMAKAKTRLKQFSRGIAESSTTLQRFARRLGRLKKLGSKHGPFAMMGFYVGKLAHGIFKLTQLIMNKLVSALRMVARVGSISLLLIYGSIVKIGTAFERSMSRVRAFSGSTNQEMTTLTHVAKRMGETTIFSASQAAEGMAVLSKAGMKHNQIVAAMPALLNMAAAGEIEVAEAAEYTALIMSQMQIPAARFAEVVDVMALAASNAVTDMRELAEAISHTGAVASQLGVPVGDVVVMLQILANAGIRGERAGTSLRNVLNRLAGGASERAIEKMKQLGIEVEDAAGNMKPMEDIVNQFIQATARLSKVGKVGELMGIFELRAGPAMLATMAAGADQIVKLKKEMDNASGAASQMANILWNNVTGAFLIMRSVINTIRIEIFSLFGNAIQRRIQAFTQWLRDNKRAIIQWGAYFGQKILNVIDWFGMLIKKISSSEKSFAKLGVSIKETLIKGIIEGMLGMTNIMIALAPAIAKTMVYVFENAMRAVGKAVISKGPLGLILKMTSPGTYQKISDWYSGAEKLRMEEQRASLSKVFSSSVGEAADVSSETVKNIMKAINESPIGKEITAELVKISRNTAGNPGNL